MLRDMRGHGNMIMLRFASSIMERCVCKDLRRKAAQSKTGCRVLPVLPPALLVDISRFTSMGVRMMRHKSQHPCICLSFCAKGL